MFWKVGVPLCEECHRPLPRDAAGVILHVVGHSVEREQKRRSSLGRVARWWEDHGSDWLDVALPTIALAAASVSVVAFSWAFLFGTMGR